MPRVIIQIEGVGAYRATPETALAMREHIEGLPHAARKDLYLTDGCGRTWAPISDGAWIFWDGVPCEARGVKFESAVRYFADESGNPL